MTGPGSSHGGPALCAQACESPLLVAVAAGSVALPTLLKLAAVMAAQNQDFHACSQLPVVRPPPLFCSVMPTSVASHGPQMN